MSDEKNVVSMSAATGNAEFSDIASVLRDGLNSIGKEGAFAKGKKVLVLALDDTDGNYDISFIQSQMTMSECIALCRVAENMFIEKMGY